MVVLRRLSFIPEKLPRYYITNTEMSYSFNREVDEDLSSHLSEVPEPNPKDWCIYRVPHSIRKGKEEAYTPQIVSIGPFHCDKKELKDMDKLKRRYVKMFFERTAKKPEEVLAFIKAREQQIRNCYSEPSNLKSDEYVNMILRDAIFILELLVRNFEKAQYDNLLWIRAHRIALRLDLLLLENQLPYLILLEIYNSIASSLPFIDICLKFFGSLFFYSDVSNRQKDFKHFTDLLTETLVQHCSKSELRTEKSEGAGNLNPLPCATKLAESGVKFKNVDSRRLLNVRFDGGKLSMPHFNINLHTETLLRNTLAWEQCHYPYRTIICDYVILLVSPIEDKRDAQFLVDKGIISNTMGDSKALASLFNKLRAEIPLNRHRYNKIYKDLNDYYISKYNRSMAKLQRLYFSDIWRGTATIVAFVFLILTLIQTIASFK